MTSDGGAIGCLKARQGATAMRVTLETSGGYGGLSSTATIDTEELPTEDVARGLEALGAHAATESPAATGPQPRYRITIHRPSGLQVVNLVEPDVPAGARPLITELLKRTHSRR